MAKIYLVLNRFFFKAFTCCISFVSFKTIITSLILTDDETESRSHTMVNITGEYLRTYLSIECLIFFLHQ